LPNRSSHRAGRCTRPDEHKHRQTQVRSGVKTQRRRETCHAKQRSGRVCGWMGEVITDLSGSCLFVACKQPSHHLTSVVSTSKRCSTAMCVRS
jgi:hypothetical protein